jgi:hypothetical protein
MQIKISNGEVTLKPLNRKLKKEIGKLLFKGIGMDMVSGEVDKVPMENLQDMPGDCFKILCDKIIIKGTNYKFENLEDLNSRGDFTDNDWDLCEDTAIELYRDCTSKKKKISSAP